MCLLAISSCDSSESNEDIHVGQLYLRSEVAAFGFRKELFRRPDWLEGDRVIGELHDDRIPGRVPDRAGHAVRRDRRRQRVGDAR